MDQHDDRPGRKLRYNDTAETASREAAERSRRGEERVVPDAGEGGAGTAASTVGGALAGGTAGFLVLGPIGGAIAAAAGALGGWWSGEAETAASSYTPDEDRAYREHYESLPNRPADRGYEAIRPAYQLGHVARYNPAYRGKRFEEIEPDLTRIWSDEMRARYGEWAGMRGYARTAYHGQGAPQSEAELQDRLPASEPPRATNDAETHHDR
jgi:hypothetical protein